MIDQVIAQLRASVGALKQVDGAAQFMTAAQSNPHVTPAAFVIPLTEDPSRSEVAGLVIQRVAITLGVILVVRNVSDKSGDAARQDMEALRDAVKASLLGWLPSAQYDPFERGRSTLLAFKDGHMWWQDIYLTSTFDRSVV